jgi:alpha-L-glutamate ligase-like protein
MATNIQDVLGMNARNYGYLSRYNKAKGKKIANSKLLTKSTLRKSKLPVPRLYRVFRSEEDVNKYDFTRLPESFVIKPNKGLGGEGIIVVEQGGTYAGQWITSQGETISIEDIKLHIGDILEGRFSIDDAPDFAFVEERIRIHPVFEKHAYHGTPDIRIIVFNRVPVMAMLRIPTRESGGRANLHQGAVGAGIDLATGITTYAIKYSKEVKFMPNTRRRVRGINIPEWDQVLELAVKCQEITKLGYLGADIVLQPSQKVEGKTLPKILELNAQPGLKIQLCNKAGLKRRLDRVEGLEVNDPEKGIKIAKALFGDQELAHLGKKVKSVDVFETVEVIDQLKEKIPVKAKIDTGAFRTSIDESLAKSLGLLRLDNIIEERHYRSALGRHKRQIIEVEFILAGRKLKTTANVVDRSHLKRPMLIGRRDLKSFVITP